MVIGTGHGCMATLSAAVCPLCGDDGDDRDCECDGHDVGHDDDDDVDDDTDVDFNVDVDAADLAFRVPGHATRIKVIGTGNGYVRLHLGLLTPPWEQRSFNFRRAPLPLSRLPRTTTCDLYDIYSL